ncbi:MAG: hypothetical protein QXX57_06000 [Nitrososphaerota archaeon]
MKNRSPVPLEVVDLKSLVRLATSRTDYPPVMMSFRYGGRELISFFLSIPFLRGSLPLFAYTTVGASPPQFLAYTNLEREEVLPVSRPEAGKYFTCPVVRLDEPPPLMLRALRRGSKALPIPVSTKLTGLDSLMRLVAAMNDDISTPPIWHFQRGGRNILAVFYMLMEYFDSMALPILCYIVSHSPVSAPFLAYMPGESPKIEFREHVSDARYIYGRVIPVRNFPFKL